MSDLKNIGIYWEVTPDGFLVNNFAEEELTGIAKNISSLFLEEIFNFIPHFHSAYISGSYLNRTQTEKSDIDFLVLIENEETEELTEEILDNFNPHLSAKIKQKFNLDIVVDTNVHCIEFFKEDLLNNFIQKCIWGEDISYNRLNFDLITNNVLDGMELDDCHYLTDNLFEILAMISTIEELDDREWDQELRTYIKLLLRCCFNSICKKINIWTRDLYYCYYFFSKEYPEFESITSDLLSLYIDQNKSKEKIKTTLKESSKLIQYMVKMIQEIE